MSQTSHVGPSPACRDDSDGGDRQGSPSKEGKDRNHFSPEHSALILWFRPGNEMDSRARPTLTIREA